MKEIDCKRCEYGGKWQEKLWIEHKTNEALLDEVNEKWTLMNTIMKIKIKSIWHLLRHNEFITIIVEWIVNSKRTRERRRKSFFEEIFGFTSYQQLKRMACDRLNMATTTRLGLLKLMMMMYIPNRYAVKKKRTVGYR